MFFMFWKSMFYFFKNYIMWLDKLRFPRPNIQYKRPPQFWQLTQTSVMFLTWTPEEKCKKIIEIRPFWKSTWTGSFIIYCVVRWIHTYITPFFQNFFYLFPPINYGVNVLIKYHGYHYLVSDVTNSLSPFYFYFLFLHSFVGSMLMSVSFSFIGFCLYVFSFS